MRMTGRVLFCALFGGLGCAPEAEDGEEEHIEAGFFDVSHTPSELVPIVYHVSWTSDVPGTSYVEFGPQDGEFEHRTPITTVSSTEHSAVLLGTKAGVIYTYRPVLVPDGENEPIEGGTVPLAIPQIPTYLPVLSVSSLNTDRSEVVDGFVATAISTTGGAARVIIDGDGDYVWYHHVDDAGGISLLPGLDGKSVLYNEHDQEQLHDYSQVSRVALDGMSLTTTRTMTGHHAFVEDEGERIAWLAQIMRDVTVEDEDMTFWTDAIRTAPEGEDQEDVFDEPYNQFDDYGKKPWIVCSHVEREGVIWAPGTHQWTHGNSLMSDEDHYYYGPRFLDAILKIDKQTGEVVWQLGGPEGLLSDFAYDPDNWWSHGHLSHLWDGGLMMFDNGDHHEDQISAISEYAWDEETMTAERVWEYHDPEERFLEMVGDARKLPGGNYMGIWSSAGFINEVTPDKEVVWRVESELGSLMSRAFFVSDLYDFTLYDVPPHAE
jgi:hypothetical protein